MKRTPYTPDELRGLTSADSFYQVNTVTRTLAHGVVGSNETVMLFADDPDVELPFTTLSELAAQLEDNASCVYYKNSHDAETHRDRLTPLVNVLDLVTVTGDAFDATDIDANHLDRIQNASYVGRIGIVKAIDGAYADVLLTCHVGAAPSLVVAIDMRLLAQIGRVDALPGAFF